MVGFDSYGSKNAHYCADGRSLPKNNNLLDMKFFFTMTKLSSEVCNLKDHASDALKSVIA